MNAPRAPKLRMLALLGVGVWAWSTACVGSREAASWVDQVRAANERADVAQAAGRTHEAIAELERAMALPMPIEVAIEDRTIVRQDLAFRLATLYVDDNEPQRAVDVASEGLAQGTRQDDVFTANLLVARGHAREALHLDRDAAADYYRALRINEHLLDESLRHAPR